MLEDALQTFVGEKSVIGAVNTHLTPLECYNAVMCLWYDTVQLFPGVINYF